MNTMLQLDAVTAERNSLYEDLINHRDSKRTVDKQWRLERERCERLESELAFYQNHSAQALSDRDKVCYADPLERMLSLGNHACSHKTCATSLYTSAFAEINHGHTVQVKLTH